MDGIIAVAVIGLICLFWLVIFGRALYKSVAGRKTQDDRHSGRMVTGKILSSNIKGGGKWTRVHMTVQFPNFSNSEVTETFIFKDTKPQEHRYEEGKTVQLTLLEDPKKGPSVKLSGGKVQGSNTMSFLFFLLFGGTLFGTYMLYKLILENIGGDWENLDQLPVFEGFIIVGPIFLLTMIFMQVIGKVIGRVTGGSKKSSDNDLKLYGISVDARVTNIEETGVKINDNPMIRFHYEFEDEFGTTHKGQDKMVLGMLELANIKDINERKIIYEKGNPSNSRLMDAMKKTMLMGCTRLIFLFVSMIFSVVLIAMFVSGLTSS